MKRKGLVLIILCVVMCGILALAYFLNSKNIIGEAEVPEGCNGAAVCSGSTVQIAGMGMSYTRGVITINKEGVYSISGEFDGYVFIKAESSAEVSLILNGVEITTTEAPAIYAKKCATLNLILADGTENVIIDERSESELETSKYSSSVIFSKNKMNVDGSGSIIVEGNGDSLHSKNDLTINSGTLTLSSSSQGMYAKKTITINGGNINIIKSEEGMQGKKVIIKDGNLNVIASDDGINASDGSGGDLTGEEAEEVYISIEGGTNYINADGDGIDSNGYIYVTGGYTYVEGPESDGDGIIDYSVQAIINGGTFIGVGSSGMLEPFDTDSSQQGVITNYLESSMSPGTLEIVDSSGNVYETVTTTKTIKAYIYSSDKVTTSETIGSGGMGGGMGGGQMPGGMQGGDVPSMPDDFDPSSMGGDMPSMSDDFDPSSTGGGMQGGMGGQGGRMQGGGQMPNN